MKYSETILTIRRENLCVRYLPCGTIAYLKTEDNARKAFKPKKVHTFDDDDTPQDGEKEKTITMKIEVKESDLAKIKELVKVVE